MVGSREDFYVLMGSYTFSSVFLSSFNTSLINSEYSENTLLLGITQPDSNTRIKNAHLLGKRCVFSSNSPVAFSPTGDRQ
jgi:hypothetical protein